MIILLYIITVFLAYYSGKNPLKLSPYIVDWIKWGFVGLVFLITWNPISVIKFFLISQALFVPVHNYFSGRKIWFIDNDTWLGKIIIRYLGEGSGQVWFFIQILAAIILIILF